MYYSVEGGLDTREHHEYQWVWPDMNMMIYLFILWLLQPQKVREENWKPFAVVCACYQTIAISDTFSFHPLFPKLSFMQVRLLISGSYITLQLISICIFVIVEREILKEMK